MKALFEAIFKIPPPQPLRSIEALKSTERPNQARLLSHGESTEPASSSKTVLLQGSIYSLSPKALLNAACAILERDMDASLLNKEQQNNMAVYCVRTPLMRYPDFVYLEAKAVSSETGEQSTLAAFSHSIYGWSDLGANAKRLRALISKLQSH